MAGSPPSRFRLDHVVIRVADLERASEDYRRLGFSVTPGGEHEGRGSRNALIAFEDGSYLELIAFRDAPGAAGGAAAASPLDRTARWRQAPEGLVDFALLPGSIDEAIVSAAQRGLRLEGPVPGGRLRPDGVEVRWRLGLPDGFDTPFLCADVTPRALRVPGGDLTRHQNGALGVRRVLVGVRDLVRSAERYQALLGTGPSAGGGRGPGGGPRFPLGTTVVELAPIGEHGEGPREIDLLGAAGARGGPLDPAPAHGARIVFERED